MVDVLDGQHATLTASVRAASACSAPYYLRSGEPVARLHILENSVDNIQPLIALLRRRPPRACGCALRRRRPLRVCRSALRRRRPLRAQGWALCRRRPLTFFFV